MSKAVKRQRKVDEIFGRKDDDSSKKKRSENEPSSSSISKISDDDLNLLKQFDLDMSFGPCTGITRRVRYERAIRHELEPPIRVLELIETYPNEPKVIYSIWHGYTL